MRFLCSSESLHAQSESLYSQLRGCLLALLPDAEIHHIGATSIPGALTKGDLDIVVRVEDFEFKSASTRIGEVFGIKQRDNWTIQYASFGEDTKYSMPVGIQLVVRSSENDVFLYLREYLISNQDALASYNRMKLSFAGLSNEEYWEAKEQFFSKILKARQH